MKDYKKRIGIFASALLLSLALAIAVFAVAEYDSSADPLISQSYLIKYINDNVLLSQNSRFEIIENKLTLLEELVDTLLKNNGSTTPPSTETGDHSTETTPPSDSTTLSTILKLSGRIEEIEKKIASINAENSALGGKYDALASENDALKKELAVLKQQIQDYLNDSGKEDIAELQEKYQALSSELAGLKTSTNSIQNSFENISKSYVALQKEVYNLNQTLKQLSSSDSDFLKDILNLSEKMNELGAELTQLATKNMSFDQVKLEKGDLIVANGSVLVMLQYGEAKVVSPTSAVGTNMEYTDLTSGDLLCDGSTIPLNHNIFIPGNGRTSVLATGEHGIFIFVGGDYKVINANDNTNDNANNNAPSQNGGNN